MSMFTVAHNVKAKTRTGDIQIWENVNFSGLFLSECVMRGLTKSGFQRPSPIQLKAIPLGRCGLDLIIQAKSGTGKTCVFTVIALENLQLETRATQVLVLAPTREIAVQISEVIRSIGSEMADLACATFIGGLPVHEDRQKLQKCHIAIGTPGRIMQLIETGALNTESIRLFVLDEADKLLEESFQDQINWIYSSLPENKQMLALSATYPEYMAQHLTAYMRNPTFVRLNTTDPALLGIKQYYKTVPFHPLPHKGFEFKVAALQGLLSSITFNQCLVFSNYQTRAQNLAELLDKEGWPTACIAGALDQKDRLEAMAKLKAVKCRILISTDLTSRGIDAENVNLVINMDIPKDHETYLHRIGRAGRYGSFGAAVTLVCEGKEEKELQAVEYKCHTTIHPLPDPVPVNLVSIEIPVDVDQVVTTEQIVTRPPDQDMSPTLSSKLETDSKDLLAHENGYKELVAGYLTDENPPEILNGCNSEIDKIDQMKKPNIAKTHQEQNCDSKSALKDSETSLTTVVKDDLVITSLDKVGAMSNSATDTAEGAHHLNDVKKVLMTSSVHGTGFVTESHVNYEETALAIQQMTSSGDATPHHGIGERNMDEEAVNKDIEKQQLKFESNLSPTPIDKSVKRYSPNEKLNLPTFAETIGYKILSTGHTYASAVEDLQAFLAENKGKVIGLPKVNWREKLQTKPFSENLLSTVSERLKSMSLQYSVHALRNADPDPRTKRTYGISEETRLDSKQENLSASNFLHEGAYLRRQIIDETHDTEFQKQDDKLNDTALGEIEVHSARPKQDDKLNDTALGEIEVHSARPKQDDKLNHTALGEIEVHSARQKQDDKLNHTALGEIEVHSARPKMDIVFSDSYGHAIVKTTNNHEAIVNHGSRKNIECDLELTNATTDDIDSEISCTSEDAVDSRSDDSGSNDDYDPDASYESEGYDEDSFGSLTDDYTGSSTDSCSDDSSDISDSDDNYASAAPDSFDHAASQSWSYNPYSSQANYPHQPEPYHPIYQNAALNQLYPGYDYHKVGVSVQPYWQNSLFMHPYNNTLPYPYWLLPNNWLPSPWFYHNEFMYPSNYSYQGGHGYFKNKTNEELLKDHMIQMSENLKTQDAYVNIMKQ